jgi:acyl-coenzyme A synthetase/AMP-(fatty) acid ligase
VELSHRAFFERAMRLSGWLADQGVTVRDRVLVHAASSADAAVAIFGSLIRGCIIVPVSPSAPPVQRDRIVRAVEPRAIFAGPEVLAGGEPPYAGLDVAARIAIGAGDAAVPAGWRTLEVALAAAAAGPPAPPRLITLDIAFINFTSGTTGAPKGVMVSHQSICSFMNGAFERFDHNARSVTLSTTPPSFDPYLTELVPSMMGGGRVIILRSPTISTFLAAAQSHGVTNFGCGPAFLELLARAPGVLERYNLSALRDVYFGHENCPVTVIRTLQQIWPHVQFINGWGTTETYGATTFHRVPPLGQAETRLSVGTPLANQEVLLLDADDQPIREPHRIGRAFIRGNSLMSGYWQMPEDSLARLRPYPGLPFSTERIYDTGDLMSFDEAGNLYVEGRADAQTKVRGYRVNLDNVQRIINDLKQVRAACVFTLETGNGRVIAGVAALQPGYDPACLRRACRDHLHDHEQPVRWLITDSVPRNANGKLDRKQAEALFRASAPSAFA